jgi:hypothetical protein
MIVLSLYKKKTGSKLAKVIFKGGVSKPEKAIIE